ncbi:MAG: glycoside hydrolase family 9 protein [Ruminococcus sp.]|nr:glycoside hydrolase family 9 protein [Ruminococcus sp.]
MFKRITSGVVSAALLLTSAAALPFTSTAADSTQNYAEALQKSLYFYECQQAGPLPDWNRVEWRADSTMIDEIPGGWYDAGDHVKFNLPMAYSASMLAWGLYQYPDGVEKIGETENYVNNLKFVLDYLAACDKGDSVVYQVGNGQKDHTWWGPVELYQYGMEDSGGSYEATRETLESSEGCSAVFGGMAAALAAGSCALKGKVDQSVLDSYLEHAENIFSLAAASESDSVYNDSDASGFYRSSHFYDELFYASNWLYIATGDKAYLDKATSYISSLPSELGSDELKYTWCQCWDDVMQGGMLLYAINTHDEFYISRVKKHVDYWTNTIQKVDGILGYCDSWGCLRYAQTAGFIAAVASDTVLADQDTSAYVKFYENQINYALGDNPDKQSYVVGYGNNSPINAHHRTAHCSWKNALETPVQNRHILYGALVGGPDQSGNYVDDRGNYINNEVADDYNAGFTALLCKMTDKYGGKTDASFPEKEQHDMPEFYVEAKLKSSASGVDLSLKITNHSAWPARVQDNLSYRYFMDLSEVIDAGYSASDVVIRCDRDQAAMYSGMGVAPAEISPVTHYKDNIYYIEVSYPDGRAALPISEGRHQCEVMLAIVFPDYQSGWDASNDFSNTELINTPEVEPTTDETGASVSSGIRTEYIPVYIDGVLYYGKEPDGTSADGGMTAGSTTPTKPSEEATENTTAAPTSSGDALYGDADLDGKVGISDVVKVLMYVSNKESNPIEAEGLNNSDVYNRGDGVFVSDALSIQKKTAQIIDTLPES